MFTWAGRRLIAVGDAAPSLYTPSLPNVVTVEYVKYRPATDGIYEIGADMTKNDVITETTLVEIHERGAKVHHVSDDIRDETPAEQTREQLSHVAKVRQKARREFEDSDEEFRIAIRQALHSGISVAEVRQITGLSRERIYQIRDDRR